MILFMIMTFIVTQEMSFSNVINCEWTNIRSKFEMVEKICS